ncbi:MAG: OmpA family protein [Prevotellaceae bacterium]|nr:OmpA family protein [Prevotellaceae bacterium]
MKKQLPSFIILCLVAFFMASCNTQKHTMLPAQPTAKDSLLVQINKDYVPTSIIGEGAVIARQEARKIAYKKNQDIKARLEEIEGIKIRHIPHDGDSIYDFTAELGDILFAYDSFELTAEAVDIIDQLAEVIVDMEDAKINITGYTDSTGDENYNLNLSKLRALAVGNRLRENGITDITEDGKGEADPVADNKTEKGRQKNRRVEIIMTTPDVK